MTTDEQFLEEHRRVWHDFSRLLFWAPIHLAVLVIVVVMFAVNGPTAGTIILSILLIAANLAITAGYFMSRRW
jgi:hypothetical protein